MTYNNVANELDCNHLPVKKNNLRYKKAGD